jgi:hypothetical protein
MTRSTTFCSLPLLAARIVGTAPAEADALASVIAPGVDLLKVDCGEGRVSAPSDSWPGSTVFSDRLPARADIPADPVRHSGSAPRRSRHPHLNRSATHDST